MPWPNARQPIKRSSKHSHIASHPCQGTGDNFVVDILFICTPSEIQHTAQKYVRSSLSEVETNNGKYNKANRSLILRVKVLTGLAIEKERKCYSICIFST